MPDVPSKTVSAYLAALGDPAVDADGDGHDDRHVLLLSRFEFEMLVRDRSELLTGEGPAEIRVTPRDGAGAQGFFPVEVKRAGEPKKRRGASYEVSRRRYRLQWRNPWERLVEIETFLLDDEDKPVSGSEVAR